MNLAAVALAGALAGACEIRAESPVAREGAFEKTLATQGPVDLEVYSRSGTIKVRRGSTDAVRVAARIRAYGSDFWLDGYTPSEQVERLESRPPIEQSGNRIKIGTVDIVEDEALFRNVTISYDITVPANARLRVTSRSGDQSIDDIEGPVEATSRSGHIRIGQIDGDVDVTTRSGNIDVVEHSNGMHASSRSGRIRLEGQPSRTWVVDTRSGDVDVRVDGAQLDAQTRSGHIDADAPGLEISEQRRDRHARGAIGKGGGRLEVTTTSGSIRVR